MELFSLIGLGITSAVLCLILKQYKPEYAIVVSIVCGILLIGAVLSMLTPMFQSVQELIEKSGVSSEYAKILLKSLGICYVVQMASDSCADAGQTAIAVKIELAGKAAIVVLCLPLFQDLAQIAFGLIQS